MQISSNFVEGLIGSGIGTLIIFGLVWIGRPFIIKYIEKKAENFATKQDTAEITRLQGEVKFGFQQIFELQRTETQLRLAAVERRLCLHQKAHTLWIELYNSTYSENDLGEVIKECEEWWEQNSLYLAPEPRIAFKRAYLAASYRPQLLQAEGPARNEALITDNWERITAAGAAIETAVSLPGLDVEEVRRAYAPTLAVPRRTPKKPGS